MANYDLMIQSYEDILANKPDKCDAETVKLSIDALKTLNNKQTMRSVLFSTPVLLMTY